jgi:hypothetical protein
LDASGMTHFGHRTHLCYSHLMVLVEPDERFLTGVKRTFKNGVLQNFYEET